MLKGLLLAAAAGAVALLATSAQAAPVSSSPAISSALSSNVIEIAQGCGRGYHRGPAGGCQRNTSPAQGACWFVRAPYGGWRMVCK